MSNTKIPKRAPSPYPDGDPCGYVGHSVWCRCEWPDVERCGAEEYERVKLRNEEIREAIRRSTVCAN